MNLKGEYTRVRNAVLRYCASRGISGINRDFKIDNITMKGLGPKGIKFYNENKHLMLDDINERLEAIR